MSDELAGLKEENRRLRELLAEHRIKLPSELKAPESDNAHWLLSFRVTRRSAYFESCFEGVKTCTR